MGWLDALFVKINSTTAIQGNLSLMLKKFWQSVTVDRNFVATMFLKILICLVETPITPYKERTVVIFV